MSFIAIFLIALVLTGFSTPFVRKMAIALGFVDQPAARKLHSAPMPLMGGLAIFGGAIITVLIVSPQLPRAVAGVLISGGIVALSGLIDDRRGLPAWAKLGVQFLGFLILIYFSIHVKLPIPEIANYTLTLFWLIGITNAINFLDNMDGLSAGISAVAAAFMLLMGLANGQYLVSSLAAAILGACLGFLRYNFKPAQIFMGDVGSLFLGFSLAIMGLQLEFPQNSNYVTWMVPIFILGVPIFDMTLVVFSRIRRGVSPNTAGKDHTSHRLVNLGFSQREAVLILYLLGGVFGMIALYVTQASIIEGYTIGILTAVIAGYIIWRLDNPSELTND